MIPWGPNFNGVMLKWPLAELRGKRKEQRKIGKRKETRAKCKEKRRAEKREELRQKGKEERGGRKEKREEMGFFCPKLGVFFLSFYLRSEKNLPIVGSPFCWPKVGGEVSFFLFTWASQKTWPIDGSQVLGFLLLGPSFFGPKLGVTIFHSQFK
jgi:hypothetical protein